MVFAGAFGFSSGLFSMSYLALWQARDILGTGVALASSLHLNPASHCPGWHFFYAIKPIIARLFVVTKI